jgi:hypothetical protein
MIHLASEPGPVKCIEFSGILENVCFVDRVGVLLSLLCWGRRHLKIKHTFIPINLQTCTGAKNSLNFEERM